MHFQSSILVLNRRITSIERLAFLQSGLTSCVSYMRGASFFTIKLRHLILSVAFLVILLAVSFFPKLAWSDKVCLQNGDCLHGDIVEQTDTAISIKHPNLGVITIPLSETINLTTQTEPEQSPSQGVKAQTEDSKETASKWLHQAFLGISGEEGNDVSFTVKTGFSSKYEDDHDRWDISGRYIYETEDREKDESKGHLNFTKDWLKPQLPWFYFFQGRYQYDSFKYWKHRLTFFVGSGYDFFNSDTFILRGRLGLGGSRTWGIDDEVYPEGQLGLETVWRLDEIHEISASATIFPDLSHSGEYRTYSKAEWRVKFDAARGLSILSGIEHEYETEINPNEADDKHYDLIYFWGIELDF